MRVREFAQSWVEQFDTLPPSDGLETDLDMLARAYLALQPYVRHIHGCRHNQIVWLTAEGRPKCSCGLAAVLEMTA